MAAVVIGRAVTVARRMPVRWTQVIGAADHSHAGAAGGQRGGAAQIQGSMGIDAPR
jgi:hypothetical protein